MEFENALAFSKYLKSSSLDVMGDVPSSLAKTIVEKYSDKTEDSVAEMMTKLEAKKKGVELTVVTKADVDHYLYPEGQAHDYVTQSRIHSNTYSGVKATGISANFSKMLAYLFSATPIGEIVDEEGKIINVDESTDEGAKNMGTIRSKYAVHSIPDLLKKNKNIKIHSRLNPKIKSRYAPIINNYKFDQLRRNEINYDGSERKLFKNISGKELLINVFETIDTVINLAIDNVKEQKLFLLGLTNSNANAMLTMMGMGVPLNDVVRFFNTPIVASISKGKRLYAASIQSSINSIAETLTDDDVKSYLLETGQEELMSRIRSTASTMNLSYPFALMTMSQQLGVDTKVLDDVYIGNNQHKKMSDLASLITLNKLVNMGSETFEYSQMFSLLRGLPSKKWQMDSIFNIPTKYAQFKQVKFVNERVMENMAEHVKGLFKESEYYKSLPTKEEKDKALAVEEAKVKNSNSIYTPELKRLQSAWFMNLLGKDTLIKSMKPTSESVFENVTILSLPHVYSAWRTLGKLKRVLEKTFAIHNPRVSELASNIAVKMKSETAFVRRDLMESIQQSFLKFLGSNLLLDINGKELDLSIDPNTTYVSPTGVLYRGEEAWTQNFIAKISKHLGRQDNELLRSIEIKTEFGSNREVLGKKLMLTADKVGDDELIEVLKRDFLALNSIEPEMAEDLFKYAALTSGLYYGRTNFSLIFPVEYALAYDRALNARLDSVLVNSSVKTDINLLILEDQFLYQFVRNNPQQLSYINKIKPVSGSKMKTERGFSRQILHGIDEVNGELVYYDLKFPNNGGNFDEIIRRYSDTTYVKLNTPKEHDYVYYRVFSVKPLNKSFSFDEADLDKGFNIQLLKQPDLPVITEYSRVGDQITINNTDIELYKVGSTVYLNPNTVKFDKLEAYKIETTSFSNRSGVVRGVSYKLKRSPDKDLDMSRKDLVEELKQRPYFAEMGYNNKYATVAVSQSDALKKANKSNALAVVSSVNREVPGAHNVDLTGTNQQILDSLRKIPDANRYVVEKDIVRILIRTKPDIAAEAANILYSRTGYVDEILGKSDEDVKIHAQLSLVFKIKEITAGSVELDQVHDWKVDISKFRIPRDIKKDSIVYLGVSNDNHVFGHVTSVENGIATLTPIDSLLFDFLTKKFYTKEELDTISEKINPC